MKTELKEEGLYDSTHIKHEQPAPSEPMPAFSSMLCKVLKEDVEISVDPKLELVACYKKEDDSSDLDLPESRTACKTEDWNTSSKDKIVDSL